MTVPADLAAEIAAVLRTTRFGRPLHVHALVTSTNDLARDLAGSGAEEGTAVLALEQSRGRGRRGRTWESPPGGLYLSVVLRPKLHPEQWPLIGFACALGVAAAAEAHARAPVRLKWPNDLLLDRRKVGGILVEAAGEAAVCGIGLNVLPPADCSAGFSSEVSAASIAVRSGATRFEPSSHDPRESPNTNSGGMPLGTAWLAEGNPAVSLSAIVPDVLLECERWYTRLAVDHDAVLAAWRERAVTLGQNVHVDGIEPIDGIAEDIDPDGALRVRTPAGIRRVLTGDVFAVERTQ